ncbi:hypothetical protein D3C86_2006120 [compost metagenome]
MTLVLLILTLIPSTGFPVSPSDTTPTIFFNCCPIAVTGIKKLINRNTKKPWLFFFFLIIKFNLISLMKLLCKNYILSCIVHGLVGFGLGFGWLVLWFFWHK